MGEENIIAFTNSNSAHDFVRQSLLPYVSSEACNECSEACNE